MAINIDEKINQYIIQLNELIDYIPMEDDLKMELMHYVDIEIPKYKERLTGIQYPTIKSTILAWILFIISLQGQSIKSLNWDLICKVHNRDYIETLKEQKNTDKMQNLEKYIHFGLTAYKRENVLTGRNMIFKILHDFYAFLYKANRYLHYANIKEIPEYQSLLYDSDGISSLLERGKGEEKRTYGNYPLSSKWKNILQVECFANSEKAYKSNYNVNTENKFIRKLIIEFLNSFNDEGVIGRKIIRIFVNHFVKSFGQRVPKGYKDFDEDIFGVQYQYYSEIDEQLRKQEILSEAKKLTHLLIAFYRNLVQFIKEKYNIEIFNQKFEQAIYYKYFYKPYEEGYNFVFHNKLESPPEENRFCVLPNIQSLRNTNNRNCSWILVNLEKINQKYREDVKKFIWYADGQFQDNVRYLHKLIKFLDCKMAYDKNYSNVITFKTAKEFPEDFLWEYRGQLELEDMSNGQLRSILKCIRKFLKYYAKKYKITNNDLTIINLKGLYEYKGGSPITEHDQKLIYQEFERNELKKPNGRLYTIAFEIFMFTNLRIGEILNLKRDCMIYKGNGGISIQYLSKTSKTERTEQEISKKVAALVTEAIELTNEYTINDDLISEYIFITPYLAQHNNRPKRINFYNYFKSIIKSIGNTLDNKKYFPYNIRHTFINNVFKEGIESGLSIAEMSMITGNSYKTANMHYRNYNEIDLYVEAMSQVTISDVDINGTILETETESNENLKIVKSDLGKCEENNCVFQLAECLLCNHFVTSVNRIASFEKMIKDISQKIEISTNSIEIEELNIQKKLLGRYLAEMLQIKEGKEGIING